MSSLSDVMNNKVCLPEKIPADWAWMALTDVCNPKQWKTISSSEMTKSGYPVFGANGFVGFYTEYNHAHESIAITCRGNTCGTINKIPAKTYITGNSMALDDIDETFTTQNYLYHALTYRSVSDAISGSAQPQITGNSLKQIKLPFAPLPEQQKIAKILTSVDEVIEKTQAQIDKLKDLKTGMMQELLTQGVGVDCKPHTEFKDSPVGRIPKGWECLPLEKLLLQKKNSMRSGPFGSALLKDELIPAGYPYLGIDNVHVEYFDKNYKRFVSSEKFEQLNKYAVYEDDVMITIMGTVGRSCVVPKGIGKALSSKHVWTMTFDRNIYLPSLICWQLNFSDWVKKQFRNESQGGVMDSISSKTLKDLWLPVPPINEQKYIKKIYDALMNQIQVKEQVLESKLNLKKALMQDLLTGKVRVQVD